MSLAPRVLWLGAAAVLPLLTSACGGDSTGLSERDQKLAEIRAATSGFKDFQAAKDAGYIDTQYCIAATDEGRPASEGDMGVHLVHPGLTGLIPPGPDQPKFDGTDGVIDFLLPETLLYEPQADGSMALVGIEYLVTDEAWRAAGNSAPPSFFGEDFEYMEDNPATEADEAHGFTAHYELHLWTERNNPRGLTAAFNPTVTCAHAPAERRLSNP